MNTVGSLFVEPHWVNREERDVIQMYLNWIGDDYPNARIRHDLTKLLAVLEDVKQDHPYALWLTRCIEDERLRYVMQLCASGVRSKDPEREQQIRVACDALLEPIAGGASRWMSWWPKSLRIPRADVPSYSWIKKMGERMSLPVLPAKLLDATAQERHVGYRHCFYLLVTRALDHEAARVSLLRYQEAIAALAVWPEAHAPVGLSIRLSALYPGLESAPKAVALPVLHAALCLLIIQAQAHGIALMIEAELSTSLEVSLSLMEQLITDPVTEHYSLLGYTVQAYTKVAPLLIMRLAEQARRHRRRIRIRLVKGGHWDEEMAAWRAERLYACPVFTHPAWTDLSYLRCIYALRDVADVVYAQFATHDPVLWSAVTALMPSASSFECAMLPELSGTLPHRMMLLSGGALRPCMYRALEGMPEAWYESSGRFYGRGRYWGYTQKRWRSVVRDLVHEAVSALASEHVPHPTRVAVIDVQRVESFKPCVYVPPPRSAYTSFLSTPEELEASVPQARPLQHRLACVEQWVYVLERDAQAWIEGRMAEGMKVSEAIRSIEAATALCHKYLQETRDAMHAQAQNTYRYQFTRPRSQVCALFWEPGLEIEHLVRPLVIALCSGLYVRIYASQAPDASAIYVLHALWEAGVSKGMLAWWVGSTLDLKRQAVRVVYLYGSEARLKEQYQHYGLEEVPVVLGVRTDVWHVCISDASSMPEPVIEHIRVRSEGGSEKVLWCCHEAVYDAWVSAVQERCTRARALHAVDVEGLAAYSESSEGIYVLRYHDRVSLEAALASQSIASIRLYTELLSEVQFWLERPWGRVLTLGSVSGQVTSVRMPQGIWPIEGDFSDVARCMDTLNCLGEGAIMSLLSHQYSSEPVQ